MEVKNKFISLQLSDSLSKKDMGKVELEPDAILMKETVITGQVPDTTGYETYTYEIKDTMTAGLLFNESIS
mgnify:CR=1 FL=1